jgi:short-subunit dehydrogenase involved in D-alanine esterification of teichoic acids
MRLQDQTILITGGSSGIGLALAKCLSEKNTVIICGRSQEKLDEARKLVPEIHAVKCDIACRRQRENLFHYLKVNYPSLDVLINNAAIVHKTDFNTDDSMIEKAEAEISTNLIAPMALSKTFLSNASYPAAIVNITTGLIYAPRAVYPIYNATKAALHSFTQVLRHQLKNANVQVIEVMMPVVDTPWHQGNAPKIAISPEKAVSEMIAELEKGKLEIRVGAVKILHFLARLAPGLAFRMINRIQ